MTTLSLPDDLPQWTRAHRRHLHAIPELGGEERLTATYLAEQLDALGMPPHRGIGGHGLVATVEGALPGPTLAYRADIDALPINEANAVPYCSQHPGRMHACGHDVHATIALALARVAKINAAHWPGKLRIVFQPNEEGAPQAGPSGAQAMLSDGLLHRFPFDAIFALHCMPDLDVGTIGYCHGGAWASSDHFRVEVRGTSCHGAYPHTGSDPIAAAATMIPAIYTALSRRLDARHPHVASVCRFSAGNTYNVIPESAEFQGIWRALDPETAHSGQEIIRATVASVAQTFGLLAETHFHRGADVTTNDPTLLASALPILQRLLGQDLRLHPPQMGAEDFSAFSARVPALYLYLGVRNPALGITHPLHSPHFDVDEAAMPLAVHTMAHLLFALAQSGQP